MDSFFKGKVVLVTGSSIGIGYEMVRQLLQYDASVMMNARNATRLEESAIKMEGQALRKNQLHYFPADVSIESDCQALIQETVSHFGRLDVLINNAGISQQGTVAEMPPKVFRKVVEVNLLGSVYPTHYALPHLRKQKGNVLFVGSASGIRGLPRYAPYASSKMALTALAETLKIEEKPHGVKVSMAYVGFTENDPRKEIYDEDGKVIAQPDRSFVKQEPVEVVANRLLNMVVNGRFKRVFTPLGKLFFFTNKWMPSFVEWNVWRRYSKGELGNEKRPDQKIDQGA